VSYAVKELFLTLQGEGFHAGRVAVFCRFSGCNLWSGREAQRAAAACTFCDTDFVGTDGPGGGEYRGAAALADAAAACWPPGPRARGARPFLVLTGGEPLLQADPPLLASLRERGFEIAVETNGTLAAPPGIDWVCVSPKAGVELVQRRGDELKLVYPQPGADPAALEELDFAHFFLQPLDGSRRAENVRRAVEYCLRHPNWRLSPQMHKWLGIP
jgi:7-carboxy-7-deazaguanine synthase (Cx14CxxC type)